MGAELAETITAYNGYLIHNYAENKPKTIFGIPVVISTARPMALEIATVEAVRVEGA
jgi:hypothetical protein